MALVLAIEISNPSARPAASGKAPGADAGWSLGVALGELPARETSPAGGAATFSTDSHAPPRFIDDEPVDPAKRADDDLLPAIARLCARAGVSARDLALIAVSAGPGGFTGVRIAVTAAKVIAEGARALGTPCAVAIVPSADAAARATLDALGPRAARELPAPFAVLLASKIETSKVETTPAGTSKGETRNAAGATRTRESAFAALFDGAGDALDSTLGPPRLVGPDDLRTLGARALVADRFLGPATRAAAERLGLPVVPPRFSARAVLTLSTRVPALDPAAALPIYPREPEAVRKWRELHPPAQ